MAELEKREVYACALAMPKPERPDCVEWVNEITRAIERCPEDEIYLIGHSLGGPAILRYLEKTDIKQIGGVVLVSSPSEKNSNRKIDSFFNTDFDFERIKSNCKKFSIIHGDNDPNVSISNAEHLSQMLDGKLIIVQNGGHLNGSAGWFKLPQCLESLVELMELNTKN